jgi:glucose-6-phosphate dehydrogenase assembly protein OpcA
VNAASPNPVLGGGGAFPVDVNALHKELRRLWDESEGTGVITRACTRNLIALARDEKEAERATAIVAELTARHPSRAFVVTAVADAPDTLEALLSAHCSLRGGGRHVCCEQITLHVGASARRRAAGAIVSLLVPDLPVVVWCLGAPDPEDPLLVALFDVADRVIVDSRALADPIAALETMTSGERDGEWSCGDFEWGRLEPWREAVARLFEGPSPELLPHGVARVVVEYGAGRAPMGAALLGGWIVDRLAVATQGAPGGLRARMDSGDAAGEDAAVDVALEAKDGEVPGEVCGIRLTGERGRVMRVERPVGKASLTVAAPEGGAWRMPCPVADEAALLAGLLEGRGPDEIYERALVRAATLLTGASPD